MIGGNREDIREFPGVSFPCRNESSQSERSPVQYVVSVALWGLRKLEALTLDGCCYVGAPLRRAGIDGRGAVSMSLLCSFALERLQYGAGKRVDILRLTEGSIPLSIGMNRRRE